MSFTIQTHMPKCQVVHECQSLWRFFTATANTYRTTDSTVLLPVVENKLMEFDCKTYEPTGRSYPNSVIECDGKILHKDGVPITQRLDACYIGDTLVCSSASTLCWRPAGDELLLLYYDTQYYTMSLDIETLNPIYVIPEEIKCICHPKIFANPYNLYDRETGVKTNLPSSMKFRRWLSDDTFIVDKDGGGAIVTFKI